MATASPSTTLRSAQDAQQYEALVNIDHTGDGCIYPAGSVVRLDHLAPSRIELLIARGYVRAVERPASGPAALADQAEDAGR
jgi:hypothetical protein